MVTFSWPLLLLCVFVSVYIVGAGYSTLSALLYMRRKNLFFSQTGKEPKVLLIIPCKDFSDTLESNLRILLEQNYPNFRIIFVSGSKRDKAVPVIEKLVNTHKHATFVTAGKAIQCSQKILNQLRAVQEVRDEEVLVFADSDSQYPANWLRSMVAPLEDTRIGATTGCLWLQLEQPTFWSAAMVWIMNVITLPMFTRRSLSIAWGGSLAIRVQTFHQIELAKAWSHAVYDDLSFARTVRHNQLRIVFVPQALITTEVTQKTFAECIQWMRRHMLATRIYVPSLYWKNLLVRMPYLIFVLSAPWLLIGSLIVPSLRFVAFGALTLLVTQMLWGLLLTYGIRARSTARYFLHEYTGLILITISGVLGGISRTIRWAGVQYILKSANETRVESISN